MKRYFTKPDSWFKEGTEAFFIEETWPDGSLSDNKGNKTGSGVFRGTYVVGSCGEGGTMTIKIGDLCRLTNQVGVYKHGFNQHYYNLFDIRPVLEDGIWVATGRAKHLDFMVTNIHNDNEGLEKVEQ